MIDNQQMTGQQRSVIADGGPDLGWTSLLSWSDTTASVPFETGIQRVTRRVAQGLARHGIRVVPVGWDSRYRRMRKLGSPAEPFGYSRRARRSDWLLVPEIPMSVLVDDLDPVQLGRAYGLRIAAVVHDLIPIRLARLYDADAQRLYRRYFRMFAQADLVVATTQLVAGHLRAHLEAEGLHVPEIAVIPLPAQFSDLPRVETQCDMRAPDNGLHLLTVATWEPRKNLPTLLRGVRLAQARTTRPIRLTLVGRRGDFRDYDAEINGLLDVLPLATTSERVTDAELARLFACHHASVYPSCEEGFGLPVVESLWLGRPCLCHNASAMAEVAPGGGTLMLDMADETAIAEGILRLASEPGLLDRLTAETVARPLRTWEDYAEEVAQRLEILARADAAPSSN